MMKSNSLVLLAILSTFVGGCVGEVDTSSENVGDEGAALHMEYRDTAPAVGEHGTATGGSVDPDEVGCGNGDDPNPDPWHVAEPNPDPWNPDEEVRRDPSPDPDVAGGEVVGVAADSN